jgi:hypothetical protein
MIDELNQLAQRKTHKATIDEEKPPKTLSNS